MVATVDFLAHDQAILDALAAIDGHHLVGFAEPPPGALDGVHHGTGPDYMVLFAVGGTREGSCINPYEDVRLDYQVTVVARKPEGARHLLPLIEAAIRAVEIPGRSVVLVTPEGPGDVKPDQSKQPTIFYATPRFRVWSTPA